MATKTLTTKIIIRNDTVTNWASSNPTPSKAELCFETDTGKYKIGDGINAWADLPYYVHIDDGVKNSIDTLIEMLNDDKFGKVDDVQVNGTSVISDKVASIVIADLQFSDGSSESLTNETVTLHKIAKTGSYTDLEDTPNIVDNLDTTSTTDVLSANQGHTLKNMIQAIPVATSYSDIETMVSTLNSASQDEFNLGANLFIQTLDVPDFWVYFVAETSSTYTYTSDQDLIDAINTNGYVQIGYYQISKLETEKVDLSDYVTTEQLGSAITTVNNSISELESAIQTIQDDETIVRTTDTLILNGGTSST